MAIAGSALCTPQPPIANAAPRHGAWHFGGVSAVPITPLLPAHMRGRWDNGGYSPLRRIFPCARFEPISVYLPVFFGHVHPGPPVWFCRAPGVNYNIGVVSRIMGISSTAAGPGSARSLRHAENHPLGPCHHRHAPAMRFQGISMHEARGLLYILS